MSDWRIRGYVQDSDEEDDLDLDDTYAPKSPETRTAHTGSAEAVTTLHLGRRHEVEDPVAIPPGSQDELALDSSQNAFLTRATPHADAVHAKSTSTADETSTASQIASLPQRIADGFNNGAPASSIEIPFAGHPTSEAPTASSTNALSRKFLATQLFSDQRLTSTPGHAQQGQSSRPATPTLQENDLDELQQDWPGQNGQISALSSPLSEARSDIEPPDWMLSSPPLAAIRRDMPHGSTGMGRQSVQVVISRQEPRLDQEAFDKLDDAEKTRLRRALRKRNPIQLHPYLLEAETYRQNLKARGLKPVMEHHRQHEKQPERRHGRHEEKNVGDSQELDSQDREFVMDDTQSSSVRQGSPLNLSSSPPLFNRTTSRSQSPEPRPDIISGNATIEEDDDEFPELSVLLQRKHDGSIQKGFKRRKTLHTFSKNRTLNRTSSLRQSPHTHLSNRVQQARAFEIPPSPPASEAPQLHDQAPQMPRVPPRLQLLSPTKIPQPLTPVMSSTRRQHLARIVDSDTDDEPPISTARQRGLQRTHSLTVLSSESSSEIGEDEDRELQQAKKRIKGVLPASWLRLDRQAQANKKHLAYPPRPRQVSEASTGPNTAPPNLSSRRASPSPARRMDGHRDPIVIDDDDHGESDVDSSSTVTAKKQCDLNLELGFADSHESLGDYEVQEHDWVAPMLPSGSRHITSKRAKGKRQMKMTNDVSCSVKRPRLDSFDRPARNGIDRAEASNRRSKTRGQRHRQPKFKPPTLSILDAPELNISGAVQIPQFLRIAARQARRQPNKGRHSPTNKHIRLRTEADTEDANSTLRDWRAGKVKRSARYSDDDAHPPLSDRVANQQGLLHQRELPEPQNLNDRNPQIRLNASMTSESVSRKRQPRMRQIKLNTVTKPRETSPTHSSKSGKRESAVSIAHRPALQKPRARQPEYRTAQLERPENEYETRNRAAVFRRKLSQLDRAYATATQLQFRDAWIGRSRNPRLQRFLEDEDEVVPLPLPSPSPARIVAGVKMDVTQPGAKPRRKLKTKVQRVDVEAREYRQPSDPLPAVQENSSTTSDRSVEVESPRLQGLAGFGARYSTDFDISPLWSGTFFHESTMIGSGEFQQALTVSRRDLNIPNGLISFDHNGTVFRWGAWTEDVASEMASLLSSTVSRLESSQAPVNDAASEADLAMALVDYVCLLRNVVRYLSAHVYFLDPVDRRSFVARMQTILESPSSNALRDLSGFSGDVFSINSTGRTRLRAPMMILLIVHQVAQIAEYPEVDPPMRQSLNVLFKALIKPALQLVLRKGMGELRGYIDENRRYTTREQGIREDRLAVESLVMTYHLLRTRQLPQWSFWDLVKEECCHSISRISHIQSFERVWYDIFALLPYLEIDSTGLIKTGERLQSVQGDWSLVVPLLHRLFVLYPESAKLNETSVNVYLRSCLTRCYNLIRSWGWKQCDLLLTTVFDFFSRRGFQNLQHEESKGSPRFLEDLNYHPDLGIRPDDRAFHIFLKTLGVGFKSLRHICTPKQIQNIAWRLVPNHRRTYHKEEDLHHEDLDGLRNQHDLLCTLYWASPPGFRPRLTSLRDLVDQTRSHREVCRLNVRAWLNLARYQISTDEGIEALDPFADWFKEIISQNLVQYKLARFEAESQYEAVRSSGNEAISSEHLQLTIKNNQAQILATIGDAVYSMNAVIKVSHGTEYAASLLRSSSIAEIFKVFDTRNLQAGKLITEVLQIFQVYLELLRRNEPAAESQQTSEDSQDYGEGFSLEDIEPTANNNATVTDTSVDFIHDSVWQLVSSCFGAESPPDDTLLMAAVETWSIIARLLVRKGLREWSNFLDSYNVYSWRQLQDTEQTRKYTALFMSTVLAHDSSSYENNKDDMLWSWFTSLVERESMLKFQHRLTTSLINRDPGHPLFRNLPFLRNPKTGKFEIKLSEFRERRLGLISSVLANMRDDYEAAMQMGNRNLPGLRREYTGLLKQLMTTMKKNYQDLGQQSRGKSAYVEFVQSVVEFLQQHTHDICPVDPFFTDSSAFPLPATDPTYVVGRLKSYVPKLAEQRTLKQLVSFVQNVSERAAIDNEQEYLASQLGTAALGATERGDAQRPTLRQVLLGAIFPAYIEQTFTTTAGWIFAKPLLQASRSILKELNYEGSQYSISDTGSVSVIDTLLSTMLDTLYSATELLIIHSGLLEQSHVLHTLALIFAAVSATIIPASHIYRRTGLATAAIQRVNAFKAFSLFVAAKISDPETAHEVSPYPPNDPDPLPEEHRQRFAELRQLCARDLTQALGSDSWVKQGETYVLVRKNGRKVIQTAVGTLAEEGRRVLAAVEEFHGVLRTALWMGEEDVREKRRVGKVGKWPMADGEMVVI
ncbi:Methyl methanesulfonate-sensitivity protein 22 [Macrophomina phaseolina MS6]|uniref:Methyl methanesulfonate-sensitivity protein 22 n=1 Tax=Macrophomina phaseolina (strain MS6) TaxID=1126212 RepID=K2S342_MACPH|nr:Methyl methanesulfonate-sensitivity protein 22 [Macrophomina phaseolina MS6]